MRNQSSNEDEIIRTLKRTFEAVSFRKGGIPNFEKLRSLFVTGASIAHQKSDVTKIFDLEQMISEFARSIESGELLEHIETATDVQIQCFRTIAHVWCNYKAKAITQKGPVQWDGVQSVHLIQEGGEWKILHFVWEDSQQTTDTHLADGQF